VIWRDNMALYMMYAGDFVSAEREAAKASDLNPAFDRAYAAIALSRLAQAHMPYISVMTDPTTGGVSASLAMLGDLNIAEPGALIGFAGARVIEQTIREKLPDGFQRAEYLHEHGIVDLVVKRTELKATLARVISVLRVKEIPAAA